MLSGSALFVAVLSSLSLAEAAPNNATAPAGADTPKCADTCMSIKIKEAATWFGHGEVSWYCQNRKFLIAYNTCVDDNCPAHDQAAGKQAGVRICAAGGPAANTTVGADPNNGTAHLSGPANAPGDNNTVVPNKAGPTPVTPVNATHTLGLNGALPTTSPSGANATNTSTSAPSRFSGATGSAAANASSQAGDASALSSSSALLLTALSSCALSLLL